MPEATTLPTCIWCNGLTVLCALCGEEIPCMFCDGTNTFSAEPLLPAHICAHVQARLDREEHARADR